MSNQADEHSFAELTINEFFETGYILSNWLIQVNA